VATQEAAGEATSFCDGDLDYAPKFHELGCRRDE
jgi:hypothetical protein